jgi:hypothetical protein
MLTFYEVSERLGRLDELTLLETLEITSEDIVNKFSQRIEDRLEDLIADLEEDAEDFRAITETEEN